MLSCSDPTTVGPKGGRPRLHIPKVLEERTMWEPMSGCRLWLGPWDGLYGTIGQKKAHRVAYEHIKGPIPEGLVLDHLCRGPERNPLAVWIWGSIRRCPDGRLRVLDPVEFKDWLFHRGKHLGPIVFHVHDHPPALGCRSEGLDKFAAALRVGVVGVFPIRVGVVDNQPETWRAADGRQLQHLVIPVRVAEAHNRPLSDELTDPHGLPRLVINQNDLGQDRERRLVAL